MTYKEFAKLIKNKRELLLLTQKQMALMLSIPLATYHRIENGYQEPNFSQLQRICQILEIDLTNVLKIKKPNSLPMSFD